MKKYLLLSPLFFLPSVSYAENWEISAHGLAGAYFGISETKYENKYPSRFVTRGDATLKIDYKIDNTHKIGVHAPTTLMYRQDDKNRSEGEVRFYPYLQDESQFGTIQIGYTKNAANQLHKGAMDISPLGIDDSNATYFLSNSNWSGGFKSTAYYTPNATTILTDGRAPKITYITPKIAGFKLGASYTVHNANRRGTTSRYVDYETNEDGYTFAAQKEFILSEKSKILTSLGYGVFNETDKEISFGSQYHYASFNTGIGYKKSYIDGTKNPIATQKVNNYLPAYFDNFRESNAYNISAGYNWEKFKTNIAYLFSEAENTRHQNSLYIWSNVYQITDEVELYGILSHLNFKGETKKKDNEGCALIFGVGYRF
ncbi:MAG: porin [Alphaproteobacteria bacterium]|nr:porin [Alphaproteobacteria bacterium]